MVARVEEIAVGQYLPVFAELALGTAQDLLDVKTTTSSAALVVAFIGNVRFETARGSLRKASRAVVGRQICAFNGNMLGEFGKTEGVGLANGFAEGFQDVVTAGRCEPKLVLAVEDTSGLLVYLPVQAQQAKVVGDDLLVVEPVKVADVVIVLIGGGLGGEVEASKAERLTVDRVADLSRQVEEGDSLTRLR